jgi:hypothetical protein
MNSRRVEIILRKRVRFFGLPCSMKKAKENTVKVECL